MKRAHGRARVVVLPLPAPSRARKMLLREHLLLAGLCIAAAHPLSTTNDDVSELNRLVDEVLREVGRSGSLLAMDPLHFEDQFRAVEHGTYRLTDATATGLAELVRVGDARPEGRPDETLVTATVSTAAVVVRARLLARTNAGGTSHGKVQGALEPVQVLLQLSLRRGRPPTLRSFSVTSQLHLLAEKYDGKTDGDELLGIVKDALDHGFNFIYGVRVEMAIEQVLREAIAKALSAVDSPF